MITIEQKEYGRDFYWRGKWIGLLARRYILVKIAPPCIVLALMFGHGRRAWYENYYWGGLFCDQLKPRRGNWNVQVDGKVFSYLQIAPIIRAVRKITHAVA